MVLAAVQDEVLSKSQEKSQSAHMRPRLRMGRRSRRGRGSSGGVVVL